MQQSAYRIRSTKNEWLFYCVWVFIVVMFALGAISCVSVERPAGVKPRWKPRTYLYSPEADGTCAFVGPGKHVIACSEPQMHDFTLIPLDDVKALNTVFPQCKEWE